jgi:group I intron endonuclease
MLEVKKCPGVYSIKNLINNKVYVGRTSNLKERKYGHFQKLKTNKHPNKKLQYAFNKYGDTNFIFEVLSYCSREESCDKEIWWITELDAIKNGYNVTKGGNGIVEFTEFTKRKLSKNNARTWLGKKGDENPNSKKCYQYDLEGNFIKEYISIREACEINRYSYESVCKCLKGIVRRHKKNQWFYAYMGEKINPYKKFEGKWKGVKGKDHHCSVEIYQYSIDGDFIKKWDAINDISRYYNIPSPNISACLRGKCHQSHGFHWSKHFKGLKINSINIRRNKPLLMLDMQGVFVKEFASMKEASVFLNIKNTANISAVCSGKRLYAYGYKWRFKTVEI